MTKRAIWESEDPLRAAVLTEAMTADQIGEMALRCLEKCAAVTAAIPEVEALLQLGLKRPLWTRAHAAFDAIRDRVLVLERGPDVPSGVGYSLLFVAENVARVLYNATSPDDPFDSDSAEWLCVTLAQFCRKVGSPEVSDSVWRVISGAEPDRES